jgi:alpha-L-fucosidase 2
MPCGNGMVGAAVYGGALDERILLNHAELWTQGRTPEMPDVSEHLATTRELLKADRAVEADGILSNALQRAGYDPAAPTPLPLADLRIRLEGRDSRGKFACSGRAT